MKIITPLAVENIFEELPTSYARHLLYVVDQTSCLAFDAEIYRLLKMFRWQPVNNVAEHLPRPLHFIFPAEQGRALSEQLLANKIDWSCQSLLSTGSLSLLLAMLKIMAPANDNDQFYLVVADNLRSIIAGQFFTSGALTIDGLTKFLDLSENDILPYRADLQKIGRKKIVKIICPPLPSTNPLGEYLTPVSTTAEITRILDSSLKRLTVDLPNYDRYREDELIEMARSFL